MSLTVNDPIHIQEIPDAEWTVVSIVGDELRVSRVTEPNTTPSLVAIPLRTVLHVAEDPTNEYEARSVTRYKLTLKQLIED